MKFGLTLEDREVPRTVYYQRLREALVASPRFVHDADRADVLIPAEDTAMEANWPRFGDQASAYIRGRASTERVAAYVRRVVGTGRPTCIVNMHPFVRLPERLADQLHVVVADVNLLTWERAGNPRTISMPALPVTLGEPGAAPRTVLASFRGALSHPCRAELARLHDGRDIVCELVPRRNHARRLDATSGRVDRRYTELLAASVFAFVPRGDAHFSYRLLEVMSFGCVPIVLSDDWVLPFDRTIDWSACALHVSEGAIGRLPEVLAGLPPARVAALRAGVAETWRRRLASLERIVETLLDEVERIASASALESPVVDRDPGDLGELLRRCRARVGARAPQTQGQSRWLAPLRALGDLAGRRLR